VTLKIEKKSAGQKTIIRLIGRIQSEHLDKMKTELELAEPPIAIDLDEVTLVNLDAIQFLSACEARGVELLHCWPYIREWMLREQDRKG
jgi:hypothetical protein